MTEGDLIKLLNTAEEYSFVPMDDKFSRYDAFDTENGVMLEIKCRNKHYDDTLIEKLKYDWNKKYAEENNLEFLYAVCMPTKEGHRIYLFDPINMEKEDEYDFKWHTKKLPANTEFRGSNWIDKEVGYLHVDDALITLLKKRTH